MTNQELVGRAMRARCNLALPTGHRVAAGETFRYLQAHLDGGAMAELWIKARNVELLPEDTTIPLPAEPVDARGRRRSRAIAAEAASMAAESKTLTMADVMDDVIDAFYADPVDSDLGLGPGGGE